MTFDAQESRNPDYTNLRPQLFDLRIHTGTSVQYDNPTTIELLKALAASENKIRFSTFMEISLYGANGFYQRIVEIGRKKDFTTSPESSELFGQTIGKALFAIWETMEKPEKFQVIEMGAGQGTLALTVLTWIQTQYPDLYNSLNYTILDYSNRLLEKQQQKLAGFHDTVHQVLGSATQLPFANVEGVFLSNELPDAFPIERVIRINGEIKQKFVTIENNEWVELWDSPTNDVVEYINRHNLQIPEDVEEPINLNAESFQTSLCGALARGAILTIDYGRNGEVGIKNKRSVRQYSRNKKPGFLGLKTRPFDIYDSPGLYDITASVNFEILETIARKNGFTIDFSGSQREFFMQVGITGIVKKMELILKTVTSWEELVRLEEAFVNYSHLMEVFGKFHCHLLLKNVRGRIKWENSDENYEPQSLKFPIHVGHPNTTCTVDMTNTSLWRAYIPESGWEIDEKGNLWLFSTQIMGSKIFDDDGNIMLDLTDPKKVKEIVESLGYTFESTISNP